jgi:tetratricopeptide (TPR) repeat protein
VDKALVYCRQAGEKAMERSAHREAVGYFEQALSVLPHLPETRDIREQAIDLRLAMRIALRPLGDFGRILAYLSEAEALADHRRLGAAYALGGRGADAVSLLTQGIEQATALEMGGFQALCTLSLGEVQLLTGRLEEAYALAERALALTRAYQERGNQAYALRLLGDIAARREPLEIALTEAHYQEALALAEELGMRPLQAHCHLGLGTLYGRVGREPQARAALSTAISLYQVMAMAFWLPQAEATLAQVEAASASQAG